jgi:hypothetical protein
LNRPRKPSFDPETVALFQKLDHQKRPDRGEERELMRRLSLTTEFWGGQTVLDKDAGPCHPPELAAHGYWFRCREVREQLLAALAARKS